MSDAIFRRFLGALALLAGLGCTHQPAMADDLAAVVSDCPMRPAEIGTPSYLLDDKRSGILLYVETDRRHVAAISPEGKLLWVRDPFADAKLAAYRVEHPRIVQFAALPDCRIKHRTLPVLQGHTVFVGYDSSQFGSLDPLTGDFVFEGQN